MSRRVQSSGSSGASPTRFVHKIPLTSYALEVSISPYRFGSSASTSSRWRRSNGSMCAARCPCMRNESTYRRRGAFVIRFFSCVDESGDEDSCQTCHQAPARTTIHVVFHLSVMHLSVMPCKQTISTASEEHGPNGPKTRVPARGKTERKERTHSQEAQTRAAFETQKIRRDNLALQANPVETPGRRSSGKPMALCLLLYSICYLGWGMFKTFSAL